MAARPTKPPGPTAHCTNPTKRPISPSLRSVKLVRNKPRRAYPDSGGIAKNDSMLRVDVFTKGRQVPLGADCIIHHVAGEATEPLSFKDEDEWTLMNDSWFGRCSGISNDLIRISLKNKPTHWLRVAPVAWELELSIFGRKTVALKSARRSHRGHRRQGRPIPPRERFQRRCSGPLLAPTRCAVVWRSVVINRPARLKREHFALVVERNKISVPANIAVIVLNHREVT